MSNVTLRTLPSKDVGFQYVKGTVINRELQILGLTQCGAIIFKSIEPKGETDANKPPVPMFDELNELK